MNKKRSPLPLLILLLGLALILDSCSYFGWGGSKEVTIRVDATRSGEAVGGSRVLSGAGGTLEIPDFQSYTLMVTAADIDPINLSFAKGATLSVKVPVGTARTFTIMAFTTQALFAGLTTTDVATSTTSIAITLALNDTDLFVPIVKGTTGRVVKEMVSGTGGFLSSIDVMASELFDPALAALSPALPSPFLAGDTAVDAEGFLYLSETTDAAYTASAPRIVKIRDADSGASVASDIFYIGTKGSDSTTTNGITSIAIDRTRGIMYFARAGEPWFYKKSLVIVDGTDQRNIAQRVPIAGNIIALDCAPDGSIFVVRVNGTPFALEQYAANPTPGTAPTPIATATTLPMAPLDVQVKGGYVYVLNTVAGSVLQQYVLADLTVTPAASGIIATGGTSAGEFASPSRFLTGPNDRVFVKVAPAAIAGVVSFGDMAGWTGWSFQDVEGALP